MPLSSETAEPVPLQNEEPYSKRNIFAWTLFDFANTSFSVMIVTFVYPLYFKNIICAGHAIGDALWGTNVSISMLIGAVVAPVLGAASDYSGRRKRFLLAFTLISILCTSLMFFTSADMILIGSVLFILANVGFEGGLVFYDAYLPEITSKRSYGRVSGYGFAMGYLGALVTLAASFPLIIGGFEPENLLNIRYSFLLAAGFFFFFSIPLFLALRDKKPARAEHISFLKAGFREVRATLSNIRNYPNLVRFLTAFFFYNDGILTIIAFASIYAANTLNFSFQELVIFFITVQTTAILGSVIFGVITDKIGAKRTIVITLLIWIFVILLAYFTDTKEMFYIVGLFAGISMGASQSASRSLMARLTPAEHSAEFFGFYDGSFGKASAIVGPWIFGLISTLAGSQRIAILSLLLFFTVGLWLILKVRTEK
ncbi:major facilitator superfamily MFS_1 [Chloroherpeton thalassium ATCC 35110]|uniref:Major facilitator superfamily MFS_1 n=1 Tax=Chloroherpeton thalassium (strain ATCC 35110 / GB-78) TaxID=517418 RepID=B3QTD7_CHLT3|nr:MFS transporter [Chloroherpeton thalassium]ACF12683.1 major facilitator superfamily MFS_1 [Chloroherpeton thalassium ATCC 35110]